MSYALSRGPRKFSLNDYPSGAYLDPAQTWPTTIWHWYRAHDLNLAHNAQIPSWQGYTGNSTTSQSAFIMQQPTAVNRPLYTTSSFGTYPGVSCDGVQQWFSFGGSTFVGGGNGNVFTFIFFGRWLAGSVNMQLYSYWGSGAQIRIDNSSSIFTYDSSGNAATYPDFLAPKFGVTKMISVVKEDPNYAVIYDGQTRLGPSTNAGKFIAFNVYNIGSWSNGNSLMYRGWMGEFLVFSQAMTQADISNIYQNYFKVKYASDPLFY